jgi:hypothetical protein
MVLVCCFRRLYSDFGIDCVDGVGWVDDWLHKSNFDEEYHHQCRPNIFVIYLNHSKNYNVLDLFPLRHPKMPAR